MLPLLFGRHLVIIRHRCPFLFLRFLFSDFGVVGYARFFGWVEGIEREKYVGGIDDSAVALFSKIIIIGIQKGGGSAITYSIQMLTANEALACMQ